MSAPAKIRRILNLLEHLQSGRVLNATQLADLCRVSRRTVFRDLQVLQESGVPVLYDAQKQGYWIAGGTFLPPTDLTLAETLALVILAQSTDPAHQGIPYQDAARDAALKLLCNLPGDLRQHVGELVQSIQIQTGPQPSVPSPKTHYEQILTSLQKHVKVRLRYNSFTERREIVTLVSPYRLLFQRRSWYVIGRSSLHRAVRTFHLGRIQESALTTDPYEIPPRFSLQRQLGNAWNLISERQARQTVIVRFQPLVAHNVAEVAWHKTQTLSWNPDGTLNFQVEVDGLKEIVWWVLGYGDQAEVLQPAELRDLMTAHVRRQAERYGLLPTPQADPQ